MPDRTRHPNCYVFSDKNKITTPMLASMIGVAVHALDRRKNMNRSRECGLHDVGFS